MRTPPSIPTPPSIENGKMCLPPSIPTPPSIRHTRVGLKQIISTPTRLKYKFFDLADKKIKTKFNADGTVMDLFLTNSENLVESSSVVSGIGDHEFVTVNTRLTVPHRKPPRRSILLWKRANIRKLRQDASNFNRLFTDSHRHETNVNKLWNCMKKNLLIMMEDNVPTKMTSSKNHKPWITTETKRSL